MSGGQWLVQETSHTEVHVLPLDDQIIHNHSSECPCGPRPQREARSDGSDGWIYTHHSLDGREFTEPDYRPGDTA